MPAVCAVKGCGNYFHKSKEQGINLKFFRFPIKEDLRRRWVEACNRPDSERINKYSRICSIHFSPSCFYGLDPHLKRREDAIPTLCLPNNDKVNVISSPILTDSSVDHCKDVPPVNDELPNNSSFLMYDLKKKLAIKLAEMQLEIDRLTLRNKQLEESMSLCQSGKNLLQAECDRLRQRDNYQERQLKNMSEQLEKFNKILTSHFTPSQIRTLMKRKVKQNDEADSKTVKIIGHIVISKLNANK